MHDEKYLQWLDRMGKARPVHAPHGSEDDIRIGLKRLQPHTWKLEGNLLTGYVTDDTKFSQTIPTNYICLGSDANGLPILKKVAIN